ncbi:unnamed protein product [Echinostoma caproni]|uniref:Reverse transcriptase domain-containing protein n=1 Tax=Echinostoma caproni TaxID=27848 RepID=A0A183B242_9TREM|nr:unnamed protein product [Echinostoma caproni]
MNLSSTQLIAIRDQLVKSLARVHELEKQVRRIPSLNQTIHDLSHQLANQIKLNQELRTRLIHHTKSLNPAMSMILVDYKCPALRATADHVDLTSSCDASIVTKVSHFSSNQEEPVVYEDFSTQTRDDWLHSRETQTTVDYDLLGQTWFINHLRRFVELRDLMNDPLFDGNRYGDLIDCCRTNQWYDVLIMCNVISLNRIPLPEPPPFTELNFPFNPPPVDAVIQVNLDDFQLTKPNPPKELGDDLCAAMELHKCTPLPKIENLVCNCLLQKKIYTPNPLESAYNYCYLINLNIQEISYCIEWFRCSEDFSLLSTDWDTCVSVLNNAQLPIIATTTGGKYEAHPTSPTFRLPVPTVSRSNIQQPSKRNDLSGEQDKPHNPCQESHQQQSPSRQMKSGRPESCFEKNNRDIRRRSKPLESKSLKNFSLSQSESVRGLVSVSFLAACQTFAAWLEDSTTISCKALNDATETVRRDWFKVTSDPEVSAERVKAHIRALKGLPSCPIDRVVNMMDSNVSDNIYIYDV